MKLKLVEFCADDVLRGLVEHLVEHCDNFPRLLDMVHAIWPAMGLRAEVYPVRRWQFFPRDENHNVYFVVEEVTEKGNDERKSA